jgi:N-acetylglucosaminyldiphosphoundecaprenol N-acetyl-beta-D-mannosaminyltransferase
MMENQPTISNATDINSDTEIERGNILGVKISALNLDLAVSAIDDLCNKHTSHYVCVTSAHGIMDCWYKPELRPIFNNSGLTTPDGMSIVWLMRLLGYNEVSRVYGPDLLLRVCKHSLKKGYKHFFYGGAPGVPEKLAQSLSDQFPGLKIAGTYSPPFRTLSDDEDRDIIQLIDESNADIVWVGLGSPKQEIWMDDHVNKLKAPVLVGVGAAFDFISGTKKQAPKWIQGSGFEWLFRLVTEPRRLWKRYIQYPYFAVLILFQMIGFIKFEE